MYTHRSEGNHFLVLKYIRESFVALENVWVSGLASSHCFEVLAATHVIENNKTIVDSMSIYVVLIWRIRKRIWIKRIRMKKNLGESLIAHLKVLAALKKNICNAFECGLNFVLFYFEQKKIRNLPRGTTRFQISQKNLSWYQQKSLKWSSILQLFILRKKLVFFF